MNLVLVFILSFLSNQPKGTVGLLLMPQPELLAAYGSYFPTANFSIDGWLTPTAFDFGASGRFNIDSGCGRDDFIITALLGYEAESIGFSCHTFTGMHAHLLFDYVF